MARAIGCILLLLAFATLSLDAMAMDPLILLQGDVTQLSSVGDLWYWIHPESMSAVHAVVETQVSAGLWDEYLAPVLLYKAAAVFSLPGTALAAWPVVVEVVRRIAEGQIGF